MNNEEYISVKDLDDAIKKRIAFLKTDPNIPRDQAYERIKELKIILKEIQK